MTRMQKRRLLSLLTSLVVFLVWFGIQYYQQHQAPLPSGFYHVSKFDDGDTIVVNMNGKNETIRFIGVDTPETHDPRKAIQCFGWTAANFTKTFIGHQPVRLEADPLDTNRDRYNRLLRYVYLQDGQLVNAVLIQRGYGFAYTSFPFTKKAEFKKYQTEAQHAKAGLWTACQPTQNKYGGYTSNDAPQN